jgi:hypothetical protein
MLRDNSSVYSLNVENDVNERGNSGCHFVYGGDDRVRRYHRKNTKNKSSKVK